MSEAVCNCVYRVSSNMDSTAEDKKPFEEEAKKLSAQYKEDKAKYDEENPKQKKRKDSLKDFICHCFHMLDIIIFTISPAFRIFDVLLEATVKLPHTK